MIIRSHITGLLLLLFLLTAPLLHIKGKAQEGRVKYRQVLNLDTTLYAKDTSGSPAFLYFKEDRSLYVYDRTEDVYDHTADSIKAGLFEKLKQGATEVFLEPTDRYGNMFYKDLTAARLFIRRLIWGKAFLAEEPLPFQNWTLLPDSTTLQGYHCRKATTWFRGRDYEAWYCPDIPVRDGPWKFHGLPGLILEIADTRAEIRIFMEELRMPSSTERVLRKPTEGRPVPYKDLKHIEQAETEKIVRFLRSTVERGEEEVRIDYNFYPIEKEYDQ